MKKPERKVKKTTNDEIKQDIESLASEIRRQASDLRAELFLSFAYTADVFNRYLATELDKRKSNRTNFGILHNLIIHGGYMTATEITHKVFRSKYAISRAIDTLEKDGLVKRKSLKGDRRQKRVVITQKGLDLVKATMEDRQNISQEAMSVLNKRQSELLKTTLVKLRKHLLAQMNSNAQRK